MRAVVAGSRSPHLYRVIVRRCDENTTQDHRTMVAGMTSGEAMCLRGHVTYPAGRRRLHPLPKNVCYSVVFGNESRRKEFRVSYVASLVMLETQHYGRHSHQF